MALPGHPMQFYVMPKLRDLCSQTIKRLPFIFGTCCRWFRPSSWQQDSIIVVLLATVSFVVSQIASTCAAAELLVEA